MWILHNLRVITSDFFEFWEPVGPSGTTKRHLGQKISCFLISGNHMWHIAKIPKNDKKQKKWKWKIFNFFLKYPSYMHRNVWKHVNWWYFDQIQSYNGSREKFAILNFVGFFLTFLTLFGLNIFLWIEYPSCTQQIILFIKLDFFDIPGTLWSSDQYKISR